MNENATEETVNQSTEKTPDQPTNPFLSTGSHIGTVFKTGDMRRYIFKRRKDGLLVLNVENIEERLHIAAKFIARYPGDKVVVVARRLYGQAPAKKFAELTGARVISGRFVSREKVAPVWSPDQPDNESRRPVESTIASGGLLSQCCYRPDESWRATHPASPEPPSSLHIPERFDSSRNLRPGIARLPLE
jgi:hypothetical protein